MEPDKYRFEVMEQEIKRASYSHFFKEFCCEREQRSGAEPGIKSGVFPTSLLFPLVLPSLFPCLPYCTVYLIYQAFVVAGKMQLNALIQPTSLRDYQYFSYFVIALLELLNSKGHLKYTLNCHLRSDLPKASLQFLKYCILF